MSEQPRPANKPRRTPAPPRGCFDILVRLLLTVPLAVSMFAAFLFSLPFMLFDLPRRR